MQDVLEENPAVGADLAVGMLAFVGENETDWSGMAAAATLSLVPVILVFFFLQRYIVEGIAGAVKG